MKRTKYVRDKVGKFAKSISDQPKKPKVHSIGRKAQRRSTVTNGMFTTGPKMTRNKKRNAVQRAVEVATLNKHTINKKAKSRGL